jgi:hypothetical protein
MGTELPPNPYPINRKVAFHTYVFFKEHYELQQVDKLLADFVLCLMSKLI